MPLTKNSNSTRLPLSNRTNFGLNFHGQQELLVSSSTSASKGKKRVNENDSPFTIKRQKLTKSISYDSDVDDIPNYPSVDNAVLYRRKAPMKAMRAITACGSAIRGWADSLPTRDILKTFVSSHKCDVYKCHSKDITSFLTAPYACAFNHESKRGKASILAVGTEQGTVEIFNTTARDEWDVEPSSHTINVHQNGIFDVQWSGCDKKVATASGDSTSCITDVNTEIVMHVLRGHTRTVKCISWDPNHRELLSTAGRDGQILVWDLRERLGKDHELQPVLRVSLAHETHRGVTSKRGKASVATRTVTSLLYLPNSSYHIVSSGSADGILRKWDMRQPESTRTKKMSTIIPPVDESSLDPTTLHNSSRSRGISCLALGSGPTTSVIFGLSTDSKIHTYNASGASGVPLRACHVHDQYNTYTHEQMCTNSFYVKVAASGCGRWLASGSSNGSAFLFDIAETRQSDPSSYCAVELRGQSGEIGALDWAEDQLATCADDGTVRIWHPNLLVQRDCVNNPITAQWSWSWASQHRVP